MLMKDMLLKSSYSTFVSLLMREDDTKRTN